MASKYENSDPSVGSLVERLYRIADWIGEQSRGHREEMGAMCSEMRHDVREAASRLTEGTRRDIPGPAAERLKVTSAEERARYWEQAAEKIRVSAAERPTRDELLGESMNRGLRHELLRQEADRIGKPLCLVRSPGGEWQIGYGEAASDLDWFGHGSTPDKAIQNALETDTVLKALAGDIPWDKT